MKKYGRISVSQPRLLFSLYLFFGRDLFFRRQISLESHPFFRPSRYRDQYIANEVQLLQDFAFQEIKQVCVCSLCI